MIRATDYPERVAEELKALKACSLGEGGNTDICSVGFQLGQDPCAVQIAQFDGNIGIKLAVGFYDLRENSLRNRGCHGKADFSMGGLRQPFDAPHRASEMGDLLQGFSQDCLPERCEF